MPVLHDDAESFDRAIIHLNPRRDPDGASRGPLAQLNAYKQRMGWTFRWVSSLGATSTTISACRYRRATGAVVSDFNYRPAAGLQWDRRVAHQPGLVAEFAAMTGTDVATYTRERPGMSAFVLEDGIVYHTYSSYARGLEASQCHVSGSRPRPQRPRRDKQDPQAWRRHRRISVSCAHLQPPARPARRRCSMTVVDPPPWRPAHATPPAAAEHWRSAEKSFHWRAIHAMPIATFLDPK